MSAELLRMNDELYAYLYSVSDRETPLQRELREETRRDPRFNMAVSPLEGQFLSVLVQAMAPKKICEVGVFTGYSSLAMAMVLPPGGHIWAFDVSDVWTNVARKYWQKAGVDSKITLKLAPAVDSMKALVESGHAGTFDLIFIDADKPSYAQYWDLAHTLLRTGGTVIADNTMFQGFVPASVTDDDVRKRFSHYPPEAQAEVVKAAHAVRAFNKRIHDDKRFAISLIPVGDGMTFGVKL